MDWWVNLSNFQQVSFVIAVTATFVMLIFLVLMLFGMGEADSFDADADIDAFDSFNDEPLSQFSGLRVLSLRGVLAFLSIGGWVAFIFEPMIGPIWASIIGIILGGVAAFLLALAFRASLKLESVGNLDYRYAVGKKASVYLKVPAKREGKGKITMIAQERYIEVDAITDDKEDILVRSIVEVIGLEDETTLIVRREETKE